jgi:hypothetical protein
MNQLIEWIIVSILATFVPSPIDPINFYLQNYIYTHRRSISRARFEWLQVFSWYILDALWYVLLLGIVLIFNIQDLPTVNGLTIIFTIIGVGAVISIVWRFVRKK